MKSIEETDEEFVVISDSDAELATSVPLVMENISLIANNDGSQANSLFQDSMSFGNASKSVCECSSSHLQKFPLSLCDFVGIQDTWKERENEKETRVYYRKMNKLIESLKDVHNIPDTFEFDEDYCSMDPKVMIAAKLSLAFNLVLFLAKLAAAILSGSLSIISSVVDSAVDLISGTVIWYTSRAIRLANIYQYPLGRNKLEPIAILMLSAIMGSTSVLVIREALGTIASGKVDIDLTIPSIVIIAATIVSKFGLYLYCRAIKSPSTKMLALDHRNDVVSNSFALMFSALGFYEWKYVDPIGAILLSLYIFVNWWREGKRQIQCLVGHTAPSWFLQIITWVCVQHSPSIIGVETVKAWSVGTNYLVEVHIVLPKHMPLMEAHDIGEMLQRKIEHIDHVDRAFVHLDYECLHDPDLEHKPIVHGSRKRTSSGGSQME